MIKTYRDYIRDYILDTGGLRLPGEHHFVEVYLVPRLQSIALLGVPDFVNPDGMKAIPGDIVFYDRETEGGKWKLKLGIEVKICYLKFSRTEYNDWMTEVVGSRDKPHIFIGLPHQGMLIVEWDSFVSRFKSFVYPNDSAPTILRERVSGDRYTLRRNLVKVAHDTGAIIPESERALPDSLRWFPYFSNGDEACENEKPFVELVARTCRDAMPEQIEHREDANAGSDSQLTFSL